MVEVRKLRKKEMRGAFECLASREAARAVIRSWGAYIARGRESRSPLFGVRRAKHYKTLLQFVGLDFDNKMKSPAPTKPKESKGQRVVRMVSIELVSNEDILAEGFKKDANLSLKKKKKEHRGQKGKKKKQHYRKGSVRKVGGEKKCTRGLKR